MQINYVQSSEENHEKKKLNHLNRKFTISSKSCITKVLNLNYIGRRKKYTREVEAPLVTQGIKKHQRTKKTMTTVTHLSALKQLQQLKV